jgi:hypothetical protein
VFTKQHLTFAGSSRAGTANIVASISFACLNMDADSTVGDGVDAVEVLAVAVERLLWSRGPGR